MDKNGKKNRPRPTPIPTPPWWKRRDNWSIFIAVLALLVSIVVGFLQYKLNAINADQLRLNAEQLERTTRPYLTVNNIDTTDFHDAKKLTYVVHLKNAGTTPATDALFTQRMYVNNIPLPMIGGNDLPAIAPPQGGFRQFGMIADPQYSMVMSGAARFVVDIEIAYKGNGDHAYHDHETLTYDPAFNTFLVNASK
jgi:hypothetical protein